MVHNIFSLMRKLWISNVD